MAKSSTAAAAKARASSKVRAQSIHLGLNGVDPKHYGGRSGELCACEIDANDMAALARAAGMTTTVLLTKNATRTKALAAVRAAAKQLKSGDLLLLTYSGHGGQIPDVTGEEDDKLDETWCLYDGQVIDDEIYLELSGFAEGVRVLVLSDSCHSGTVTRAIVPPIGAPEQRSKMMPPAVAMRTYREHQAFYDKLQKEVSAASPRATTVDPDAALANVAVSSRLTAIAARCKASVLLISGCQDNQTSMDGAHNGAFTEQLLAVWNDGRFRGHYATLYARVRARMPARQSPNLFVLGPAAGFLRQPAFSV